MISRFSLSWKLFLIFLDLRFSIILNMSSSKGFRSSIGDGHLLDFKLNLPDWLSVDGLRKKKAFHRILFKTLSTLSSSLILYVFKGGIGIMVYIYIYNQE